MKKPELHKLCCGLVALSAVLTVPEVSFAQSGRGGEGFLFETPKVSFAFSLGYSIPNAKSDIFDFTEEQLTLEKSDFHRSYLGGEAAIQLADRLHLVLGVGHAESSLPSEFRDWVDGDDLPIEQETIFSTTPVTVIAAPPIRISKGVSSGNGAVSATSMVVISSAALSGAASSLLLRCETSRV